MGEFEQTNPVGLGADDQRSQGTLQPVNDDAVGAFDMSRRLAEGSLKGFAKPTGRLVAVRPACVIRFDPLADFQKCTAHASSPTESLKGHAIVFAKIAADTSRLHAQVSKGGIRHPVRPVPIALPQWPLDPSGRLSGGS